MPSPCAGRKSLLRKKKLTLPRILPRPFLRIPSCRRMPPVPPSQPTR